MYYIDTSHTSYNSFTHKIGAAFRLHTFTTLHNVDKIPAKDTSAKAKKYKDITRKSFMHHTEAKLLKMRFRLGHAARNLPILTGCICQPTQYILNSVALGHSVMKRASLKKNVYAFKIYKENIGRFYTLSQILRYILTFGQKRTSSVSSI